MLCYVMLFSIAFFRKLCRLWDKAEKNCTAGKATNGSMAHIHCMLDTKGYKNTLRICTIHYLPTWCTDYYLFV